jgi:hypothetical protein
MAAAMDAPTRTRLIALAVLLAVSVPLVIVAAGGGGDEPDEEPAGELRVERSAGRPELIVYVTREVNVPDRADGDTVTVECVTAEGDVVGSQSEPWPFSDTDQGTLDPHAHMSVNPARINEVESCRLKGTDPELEGPVA